MEAYDLLIALKEQLYYEGISQEALEEISAYSTFEEIIEFLNDCNMEIDFTINCI